MADIYLLATRFPPLLRADLPPPAPVRRPCCTRPVPYFQPCAAPTPCVCMYMCLCFRSLALTRRSRRRNRSTPPLHQGLEQASRCRLCLVRSFTPSSQHASASPWYTLGPTICPCGGLACRPSTRRCGVWRRWAKARRGGDGGVGGGGSKSRCIEKRFGSLVGCCACDFCFLFRRDIPDVEQASEREMDGLLIHSLFFALLAIDPALRVPPAARDSDRCDDSRRR